MCQFAEIKRASFREKYRDRDEPEEKVKKDKSAKKDQLYREEVESGKLGSQLNHGESRKIQLTLHGRRNHAKELLPL